MNANNLNKTHQKINKKYTHFREHLNQILKNINQLTHAKITNNIYNILKHLKNIIHKTHTNNLLNSKTKNHHKAREN